MLATTPEPTGSETAANTTGIAFSSVAPCIAIATGVAMPTIRSTSSAMKLAMIWFSRSKSRLQFCSSISKVTPFSASMAASWALMLATIWLSEASSTRLQMPTLKLVFSSAVAMEKTDKIMIRDSATAISFFMGDTYLSNHFFCFMSGLPRRP